MHGVLSLLPSNHPRVPALGVASIIGMLMKGYILMYQVLQRLAHHHSRDHTPHSKMAVRRPHLTGSVTTGIEEKILQLVQSHQP